MCLPGVIEVQSEPRNLRPRLLPRYLLLALLTALLALQIGAGLWTLLRLTSLPQSCTGIEGAVGRLKDAASIRLAGGYHVERVAPGSPGGDAGLQAGDLIVSVAGIPLKERPEVWFQIPSQKQTRHSD